MDSDCNSYSYGDDDYYDDNDYYDDDAYSIDSCYQYDDNSILSSASYASDSNSPRNSTSWDYDSDDDYLLLSSPLQDEKIYDNHNTTLSRRNKMSTQSSEGVLTRIQRNNNAAIAFRFVIEELINEEMDGPVAKSLLAVNQEVADVRKVLSMTDEDIDDLHYFSPSPEDGTKKPASPTKKYIGKGNKGILRRLKCYEEYRSQRGDPIFSDWSNVSGQEFDNYRVTTNNINVTTNAPPQFFSSNTRNTSASNYSPVEQFKRGIRRDMDHFDILKSKRDFKSWHSNILSISATQDVEEILDPNYIPSLFDEPLFKEKQKYMYAVAVKIIKTDIGIEYVGAHEHDKDAQKVFSKVFHHYLHSRTADIDSSQQLKYITSAKFGSDSWNGTAVSFISHWKEQVRSYNKLVDPADKLSQKFCHTMLKNAVYDTSQLRHVQDLADQLKISSGRSQTYEEYCSLLVSAAISYDNVNKTTASFNQGKRRIYQHEIGYEYDYPPSEDDEKSYFNVNTHISEIQAYKANFQKSKSNFDTSGHLPMSIYEDMDDRSRSGWRQVAPQIRKKIVQSMSTSKTPYKPPSLPNNNPTFKNDRKINLHEITLHDLLANYHLSDDNYVKQDEQLEDNNTDITSMTETTDGNNDQLLIQAVKTNKPPNLAKAQSSPADIRNILSNPSTSKRAANVSEILYRVRAHDTSSNASLVDRGANGGIAGNDVKIIERLNRRVDVQGIDNHQMNDIPIVTAGGVTNTQKGDVIVILHQYAYVGKGTSIHSSAQIEAYNNHVDDRTIKAGGK